MQYGLWSRAQVAGDQQQPDLGGSEQAVRQVEAGQRVGGQVAFRGEQQKGHEHRDRDRPVHQAGGAEPGHHGDGADEVGHVVDVESVARTCLLPNPRECAVEAVAEPVQDDAEDGRKQHTAVTAGERVGGPGRQAARRTPRVVSWSEVIERGKRRASHSSARRSEAAVTALWMRGAEAKTVAGFNRVLLGD